MSRLINVKGTLYGTTENGGRFGYGTVFAITPQGAEKIVYSFEGGADGFFPLAGLTYIRGSLYGTTEYGGTGVGTLYKITTNGKKTVVHNFGILKGDGYAPKGDLIAVGSELFGTTYSGCSSTCNCGTVFEFDP